MAFLSNMLSMRALSFLRRAFIKRKPIIRNDSYHQDSNSSMNATLKDEQGREGLSTGDASFEYDGHIVEFAGRGPDIESANFQGADLVGQNFAGAAAGEANFQAALLEDAILADGVFRFAQFSDATLDGAICSRGDFWGATLTNVEAQNVVFENASLRETNFTGANLKEAVLKGANLTNANFSNANLHGVDLSLAVLKRTNLRSANLSGAVLVGLNLDTCDLDGVLLADAWLERSRLSRSQLGSCIGEERQGDWNGAARAYLAIELNFRGLGDDDAARWAYIKRRRMGKNLQRERAMKFWAEKSVFEFSKAFSAYIILSMVEFVCDYGESVTKVIRSIALLFFITMLSLILSENLLRSVSDGSDIYRPTRDLLDVTTYTMAIFTAAPPAEMKLNGQLANFGMGVVTSVMIVLLGLLGFVLGNRIRS